MGWLAIRTQADVARILGVSPQAVQQTERMALFKIRSRLEHMADELGILKR